MRVLILSFSDPLGAGGYEVQVHGLLRALRPHGVALGALTVAPAEAVGRLQARAEAAGHFSLGVRTVPWTDRPYPLRARVGFWLASSPSRYLAEQFAPLDEGLRSALADCCQNWQIDVIHCVGLRPAYFLTSPLPAAAVCDLVDSITLRTWRAFRLGLRGTPRTVPRDLLDFWKTRRVERDVLRRLAPAPVAVVSAADAAWLRRLEPDADVRVVPFGIDYDPAPPARPTPTKSVAFWGFLDQMHNLDALYFLHDRVWPAVRERHPDATLHITGRNMHDGVRRLHNPGRGVRVWPAVDDLGAFVAQAEVTCWPFRCASGVKTKVLESMTSGKPVVSTAMAVEYLPPAHLGGFRVADTAAGLANHVAELLGDPAECRRLGELNRAVIRDHHTWDRKALAYLDLYRESLARFGSVSPRAIHA